MQVPDIGSFLPNLLFRAPQHVKHCEFQIENKDGNLPMPQAGHSEAKFALPEKPSMIISWPHAAYFFLAECAASSGFTMPE